MDVEHTVVLKCPIIIHNISINHRIHAEHNRIYECRCTHTSIGAHWSRGKRVAPLNFENPSKTNMPNILIIGAVRFIDENFKNVFVPPESRFMGARARILHAHTTPYVTI